MSSIPTSFNPSDYQFLLKSLNDGNYITKAESLKRFNTLVTTDKKQFSIYAKRIVLTIQDFLLQSKEDINLLACTLTLQIINLNPREIQYYIRTKLLKNLIKNLGDNKPQIRKTSHYCLLAYVKTYKSFDELIPVYSTYGLNSSELQLRQKSINSFQSLLVMEMKFLNWNSGEFRKIFQLLLSKLKDQSQIVQKATEQCLLCLCKFQELRHFSKKLSPTSFQTLREFCEIQKQCGNLQEIKLDIDKQVNKSLSSYTNANDNNRTLTNAGHSLLNFQKVKPQPIKRSIIDRIQQIRKNSQTPKPFKDLNSDVIKKSTAETHRASIIVNKTQVLKKNQSTKRIDSMDAIPNKKQSIRYPSEREKAKSIIDKPVQQLQNYSMEIKPNAGKQQKIEQVLGRRLIDDLKNEKDWKVRLQAVQELQLRFQTHKDNIQLESLSKTFIPILIKLLTDQNFKIALISLKIIQQTLKFPSTNLSTVIPQLVEKLSDSKIALRQNISKLIRTEYSRTKQKLWIENILGLLRKNPNSTVKEEILTILSKMYEEEILMDYPFQEVLNDVCPLMDELKTKIKIKTLDLLVLITMKFDNFDTMKGIIINKLNQIYYEMYCQKATKELKLHDKYHFEKQDRSTANPSSRKYTKNSGNTTSSSLQRQRYFSHADDKNTTPNTVRNSSFVGNQNRASTPRKPLLLSQQRTNSDVQILSHRRQQQYEQQDQSNKEKKKTVLKSFRKKVQKAFDYKALVANTSTILEKLMPFNDPQKEMKTILGELKSDDWQVSYQALTKLRRIIEHHSYLLTHSLVRILMPQIMKLVESLRSSLSKNAVITLSEMSHKVKKLLDTQLDLIFNKLIKRTLDANSFIYEEVKKSLVAVCVNSNQSRITTLLVTTHTSRAIQIKLVIAHILEQIIMLPKYFDKQLQRLVAILVDFLSEGSLQIRQKTKAILSQLLASEKASLVMTWIPQDHLLKLKKNVSLIKENSNTQRPNQHSEQIEMKNDEANQIDQTVNLRRRKNQKITVFPNQFNELDGLLQQCQSSDWKARAENMSKIFQIIQKYPEQTFHYRLSSKIIDVLSQQISDPNVKVATNALKIFIQLTSITPKLIEYNLSVIANEIFNCFASNKPQIRTLSEELFRQICENTEKWMLLQHLCHGSLYGVQKSRPVIIDKLTSLVGDIYRKKPSIVQKNLYSTINKLVDENKPQITPHVIELLRVCQQQIGSDMMSYLKPKSRELLESNR